MWYRNRRNRIIYKDINCKPITHIDSFIEDKLGTAKLYEEVTLNKRFKIVKIIERQNESKTVSILVRDNYHLLLDESESSLRDALCVVRSIFKSKPMLSEDSTLKLKFN